LGFCEKGAECTDRHVRECPEFDKDGVCNDPKCKLPHIERAGRRRAAAAAAVHSEESTNKEDADDMSESTSEDEENDDDEVAGSDVDSDTLSEYDFLQHHEQHEPDTALQQDFISF
jgi:hypothetical protein